MCETSAKGISVFPIGTLVRVFPSDSLNTFPHGRLGKVLSVSMSIGELPEYTIQSGNEVLEDVPHSLVQMIREPRLMSKEPTLYAPRFWKDFRDKFIYPPKEYLEGLHSHHLYMDDCIINKPDPPAILTGSRVPNFDPKIGVTESNETQSNEKKEQPTTMDRNMNKQAVMFSTIFQGIGRAMIGPMLTPRQIIYNDPATIVFWSDGSKTVVKRMDNEAWNPYNAFCAALAKRIYGSNSQVNRLVKSGVFQTKKDKAVKKEDKADADSTIKEILRMKNVQHMSYAKIAKKLNLDESVVKYLVQAEKTDAALINALTNKK